MRIWVLLFLSFVLGCPVLAQDRFSDLYEEIQAGRVVVEETSGTGGSSGMVIRGVLQNTTGRPIRIRTILSRPIYLRNNNYRSQDMLVVGVYEEGGLYYTDGNTSFIKLPSKGSLRVKFLAYCMDFEKDNPDKSDEFYASTYLPSRFSSVALKITNYHRRKFGRNIVKAAQIALWLDQGISIDEIRKKFDFDHQDVIEAYEILYQF